MPNFAVKFQTSQDFRCLLRLTSLLCILTGVLSLLVIVLPKAYPPFIEPLLIRSLDESLGFVLIGFAIRLSRLEQYRPVVRLVLWAARYGLLAVGILGIQGTGLLGHSGDNSANAPTPGLAVSIFFILISGTLLLSKGRHKGSKRVTVFLSFLGVLIASCWISVFLTAAGLVPQTPLLGISVLPLVLVSLVTLCMSVSGTTPRLLELLGTNSPAAEAVRQALPAAICLPVVLAILQNWAETNGYVQPGIGLLANVLISAGTMATLVGWNIYRLAFGNRMGESVESAAKEWESFYKELLESISEPVWIFDEKGTIALANGPARPYTPRGSTDSSGLSMLDVLGKSQFQALARSVIFGRQLREITLYDAQQGAGQIRQIHLVRALKSRTSPAISFILVLAPTGAVDHQEPTGLLGLHNALYSEVHLPVRK